MVSERQIIAILTAVGSFAALGFAIYNLYENFKNNNATVKAAVWEPKR